MTFLKSKAVLAIFALAGTATLAACESGCKDPQTAKTVEADILTVEQTLCILNNSTLQSSEIATACNIASALTPAIEQVVGAHRAAESREGMRHVSDAGAQ